MTDPSAGPPSGSQREDESRAHWLRWLPGLHTARHYQGAWLRADVTAGLVLAALLVPVGMGYAEAARMPVVTGLYTTITCLVAYALFGPSRRLVLGPDSSLAPLIAAAVPIAATAGEAIAIGGSIAVVTGVLCIAAGLARIGTITELLSEPLRLGYLAGLALIVISEQLPKVLGFSVDADGFVDQVRGIVDGVVDGQVDGTTLAIGVTCLVFILVLGRVAPRFPAVLLAVVGATALSALLGLADEGVSVVGPIPQGFPAPALPDLATGDLGRILAAALGIALVAMADTSALSRSVAHHGGQHVDPNQEVVALGASNVATGLFQGFPTSASSSRTAVAESLGTRSQLTGMVAAAAVLLLLVAGNDLVTDLPQAALAAVVIAAVLNFLDVPGFRRLWDLRRSEFVLAAISLVAVVLLGPLEGIAVAVVVSLANFVRRALRPHDAVLARVEGRKGYHDQARNPSARNVPGLLIYRFDAPLFFANAEHFARRILALIDASPEPVRWVVVAAEPVTDVDTSAATVLDELLDELATRDITLAFAELKGPTKDRLRAYGLAERIGEERFYPTLGTAVSAYVDATGVDWVDWQDRPPPV